MLIADIKLGDIIKYRNGNYNEVTERIKHMLDTEYTKSLKNIYVSSLDIVIIYKVNEKVKVLWKTY